MLRTSSDKWFWQDSSPDWQEYLNTPWSEQFAPITEVFRELGEQMGTFKGIADDWLRYGSTYNIAVERSSEVIAGLQPGGVIPHIQTIFTDPQNEIEGPSGPDTHDDRGRPRLDSSGGVARPVSLCPRHGLPMDGGWCRRCRR